MFTWIADRWISRFAAAEAAALAEVAGRQPAVAVTGGSRGIGLAIARRFHGAGRTVLLIARSSGDLDAAATSIGPSEGQVASDDARVLVLALDVTAADAGERIEAALAAEGCYLDILVNNAGLGLGGRFVDQEPERIDRLVDLNVGAVTRLTRYALPRMLARGRGGIVNVSSLGGLMPGPYQAAYYASKAYVVSLTRALAFEARGRGVRIAALLPGPVETEFHADMGADHAAYRYLLPASSPDAVAASAYRGYRLGHRLIVPGVLNWVLARISGAIPYALIVPTMGFLLWPGRRPAD